MPLTLDSPLVLYSIPLAWLTVLYPAVMRTGAIRQVAGFDNVQPRHNMARLEKKGVPADTIARIQRMADANANGNEVLPVWLTAVLAGLHAGLDNRTLNYAAAAFVGLRVAYNTIYINQSSEQAAGLRSFTFVASIVTPLTIIVKAANKLNA